MLSLLPYQIEEHYINVSWECVRWRFSCHGQGFVLEDLQSSFQTITFSMFYVLPFLVCSKHRKDGARQVLSILYEKESQNFSWSPAGVFCALTTPINISLEVITLQLSNHFQSNGIPGGKSVLTVMMNGNVPKQDRWLAHQYDELSLF